MKILKTKNTENKSELTELFSTFDNNNVEYTLICRGDYKLVLFNASNEFVKLVNENSLVNNIVDIKSAYPLASREYQPEDTIVKVGDQLVGNGVPCIIAGPCAVENHDQLLQVANDLNNIGVKFFRGGAYKPRTSPYAFQGLKQEGLELLQKVKDKYNMKIVTELVSVEALPFVEKVADIIQIGTRNMQNFELLKAVGKSKTPVLLKRGMSATIDDLLMSAEYIMAGGNTNVILCERGIRTYEKATRNTLDLNAVPLLKMLTHLPVIVDPSHGTGIRELVGPMALAAIACGANGVTIEVHSNPDEALSDGPQSLKPEDFKPLYSKIHQVNKLCNM